MSDTFREQLVTRYRAAALRVTKDELHEVMKEYDRLAPEREREKRALVWFQSQVGRHPGENGEGCNVCPYYACEDDCLAEYLVREAVKACILPPEEAK